MIKAIEQLFTKDLLKLQQEIAAYSDEGMMWEIIKGTNNSAGNLCLHLIGNLNTYIGAILGHTGYIRNRDLEFSLKHVPKALMREDIDKVIIVIKATLEKLTEEQLQENYPQGAAELPMTTLQFLLHLLAHLSYHLGQINYHRRMITNF
ncbi:MAG: DUF1572 family protein [Ferruginibacter sp.]|nr:DUF1572 family protein [Ferruginibacter sp.]